MKPSNGFRAGHSLSMSVVLLALLRSLTAFQCEVENNPYNCSCYNSTVEYKLHCPSSYNKLFSVEIFGDFATSVVLCSKNATPSDFRLLDGVNIPSLGMVDFFQCPLPSVPFRQVLQLQNPLNLNSLRFSGRILRHNVGYFKVEGQLVTTLANQEAGDILPTKAIPSSNNKVESVASFENVTLIADLFQGLANLQSIELSSNNIFTIPEDIFKHTAKLQYLDLSFNEFESLPQGLLKTTPLLETFDLVGNRAEAMVIPAGLFENLTHLERVTMDGCNIEIIPENTFRGAVALGVVSLKSNRLKELPATLFQDTIKLQSLKLQNNEISNIPRELFANLRELISLDLSQNQIVNISKGVFWNTEKLAHLDISKNSLKHMDLEVFEVFTCNLRSLDLSDNHLSFPGDNSPFNRCVRMVDQINLFNNSITRFLPSWQHLSVKQLILRRNRLTELYLGEPYFAPRQVDVTENNISVVHLLNSELTKTAMDILGKIPISFIVTIYIDGNPIACDCKNYELLRYFEHKLPKFFRQIDIKPGSARCVSPPALRGRPITSIPSVNVTCSFVQEAHSAPCPRQCECKIRSEDRALLVLCRGANLTSVPDELPTPNGSNHTELDVSQNAITSLAAVLTRPGYEKVTKLFASDNRITKLNLTSLPSTLEVLELHSNNIATLPMSVIDYFANSTNLSYLTLGKNPWDCRCSSTHFINFVHGIIQKIRDLDDMKCSDGRPVGNLGVGDICPNVYAILSGVIVGSICFVTCGLVIGYYRYQQEIKVWLFANQICLWWVTEEELDRDKTYDAFICFSHKDQDFVENELTPNLENGPTPFKLCIHTRDFIPGEWITDQIISAVENSRRTIIVLSPNFVESEWGRMEFRTAHAQSMSEGRARVIVILYRDVGPTEQLEPELRAYLKMNTYVEWGDPRFWDKLRYALPHPPNLQKTKPELAMVRQVGVPVP